MADISGYIKVHNLAAAAMRRDPGKIKLQIVVHHGRGRDYMCPWSLISAERERERGVYYELRR